MMRTLLASAACMAHLLVLPHSLFPGSAGTAAIKGSVLLPEQIQPASAPKEARVIIYLQNFTAEKGRQVLPWEAPVVKSVAYEFRSLKDRSVAFAFENLPKGTYSVSVLVDAGRPHVPRGSTNFTAFPGDYAGGTKENIDLDDHQTIEVFISEGFYVTIPEGYEAPLYAPQ